MGCPSRAWPSATTRSGPSGSGYTASAGGSFRCEPPPPPPPPPCSAAPAGAAARFLWRAVICAAGRGGAGRRTSSRWGGSWCAPSTGSSCPSPWTASTTRSSTPSCPSTSTTATTSPPRRPDDGRDKETARTREARRHPPPRLARPAPCAAVFKGHLRLRPVRRQRAWRYCLGRSGPPALGRDDDWGAVARCAGRSRGKRDAVPRRRRRERIRAPLRKRSEQFRPPRRACRCRWHPFRVSI